MAVADYMSKDLITLSPDDHINKALDLMKSNQINQIPVVKDSKILGLITREDVAKSMPSTSTSLSIYEINYIISKSLISEIMQKDIATIKSTAQLEDAVKILRDQNINVLMVVDNEEIKGILTKNDIFDAFLQIAGYDLKDSVFIRIKVSEDSKGLLAKLGTVLAENDFSILNLVVVRHENDKILELHIKGYDVSKLNVELANQGFNIEEIHAVG